MLFEASFTASLSLSLSSLSLSLLSLLSLSLSVDDHAVYCSFLETNFVYLSGGYVLHVLQPYSSSPEIGTGISEPSKRVPIFVGLF